MGATAVFALLPAALLSISTATARADLPPGSWVLGGRAGAAVITPDATYLASRDGVVSPRTGGGVVALQEGDGVPAASDFPRVAGSVNAATADGAGGWFIAGSFAAVDGQPRRGLAHVLADGTVDPAWSPAVAADTACGIALAGDRVVVCDTGPGSTGIESDLIVIDRTSGAQTARVDGIGGLVEDMISDREVVRFVGSFTNVGGVVRQGAAAVDVRSGKLTDWNPVLSSPGTGIAQVGDTVYLAGEFGSVGGLERKGLAAVSSGDGGVLPWNPAPDGAVTQMVASRDAVAVTGDFSSVGGASRQRYAILEPGTGRASSWSSPGDGPGRLGIAGPIVYVTHRSATGLDGRTVERVDARTGSSATLFRLRTNGPIDVIEPSGDRVYVGGRFSGAGLPLLESTVVRVRPDGALDTSFAVRAPGGVGALAVIDDTVYLGGGFAEVNGHERNRLAAVDGTTGAVRPWAPIARTSVVLPAVDDLAAADGSVLAMTENSGLGAFDATTGARRPWRFELQGQYPQLLGIEASRERFYAHGRFDGVAGIASAGLVAIDADDGRVADRSDGALPDAVGATTDALHTGSIDVVKSTNEVTAVNQRTPIAFRGPDLYGQDVALPPTSLQVMDGRAYVSGGFTTAAGSARAGLAAVELGTGRLTGWTPRRIIDLEPRGRTEPEAPGTAGRILAVGRGRVVVGGAISAVDGRVTGGAVVLTDPLTPDPPPDRAGPTVTFRDVPDGASIGVGYNPQPSYDCEDPLGVDKCEGLDATSSEPDPAHPGFSNLVHTFTVTARDRAGNVSRNSVRWSIPGYQPTRLIPRPPGGSAPPGTGRAPNLVVVPPADSGPVAAVLKRADRELRPLLRGRRASSRVRFPTAGRLTVAVRIRTRKGPRTVARGARSAPRAGAWSVRVAPSRSGGRALRGRQAARVTVEATYRPRGGTTTRASRTLTLRR